MGIQQNATIILLILAFSSICAYSEDSGQKENPAIDLGQWEEAIQQFEFRDKVFPPPEGGIVFAGSSSFWLWNEHLADDIAPMTVIPRGFGGSTMRDLLYYTDRIVTAYKPRAVVVYEGDNDIADYGLSPEAVRADFESFVAQIHKAQPTTRIYILSIKPSFLREKSWPQQNLANQLLKALCETDSRLTYIDVATPMFDDRGQLRKELFIDDGLHMNQKGYALWRSIIRPVLLKNEAAYEGTGLRDTPSESLSTSASVQGSSDPDG